MAVFGSRVAVGAEVGATTGVGVAVCTISQAASNALRATAADIIANLIAVFNAFDPV
jgi:hypothetical protein